MPPIPKKKPPVPKLKVVVPIPAEQSKFGVFKKCQTYRCGKCRAVHEYRAQKCQRCGWKLLVPIPDDECRACEGRGTNSKGGRCFPCNGLGKRPAK